MKPENACPFCGYLSTQILGPKTNPETSTHAKGYQVECTNCGARGPCGMATNKDAVSVWDNGDIDYKRPYIQHRKHIIALHQKFTQTKYQIVENSPMLTN